MGLTLSVIFGLTPMILFAVFVNWLDRFEREPKGLLIAVFLWGACVAAGVAFILNSFLGASIYNVTGSPDASQLTTGSIIAPFVEESLKWLGVFLVYFLFEEKFDSITDGIIFSGITALGFAATENIYYIYNYGYLQHGFRGLVYLFFVRSILVGWQHPFFTAFSGIGLSIARISRSLFLRFLGPVGGWTIAILSHSLHNTVSDVLSGNSAMVIGTLLDWLGWVVMAAFIIWAIVNEHRWVRRQLQEEMEIGVITPDQYRTASSLLGKSIARIVTIGTGRYWKTRRFFQLCGILAHKKELRKRLGDNAGFENQILRLRRELIGLSAQIGEPFPTWGA